MKQHTQEADGPTRPEPQDGPQDGDGSETNDSVLQELLDSNAVTLDSFTANPSTLPPCGGQPATLSWRITKHPERAKSVVLRQKLSFVYFTINLGRDFFVNAVGNMQIHPPRTTVFVLSAGLGTGLLQARQGLDPTLILRIDESSCSTTTITADQLLPLVQVAAEQFLRENDARLRAPVGLDIGENGIHVHLAIVRPGKIDVDVDVDVVFFLYPNNCAIQLTYARYNVDADLPWWLYFADPLIVGIIEAFLSKIIGNELKGALLSRFQSFLNSFIPSNLCVCRVSFASAVGVPPGQPPISGGALLILTCPR